MSKFRKLVFSLLSFLILFSSSLTYFAVPKVSAQDTNPWYFQSFPQWYTKVYDTQTSPPQEIFGERYTAAQVQWVIYSLISIIVYPARQTVSCIFKGGGADNCISSNPLVAYNPDKKPHEYKGVFATLFDSKRSISGVNYVRSKLASHNVVPQAEAQTEGFGFRALNPIQNIWRICRDIMYGFFVIIIIIFAFMVMFRVKLNPQTVVTIQSAIPKIIITLLLVTFSYAIAGFMIDLMYVVIGLVALVFSSFGFITGLSSSASWSFLFKILTDGPGEIGFGGIIAWFIGYWWAFVSAYFASFGKLVMGGQMGTGGAVVGVVAWLLGIFICIGVFIWLVITMAKVFILLLRTYLNVFISVIFSPFMIGFGAIMPTGGFNGWLKGLVTNLLVYPVTGTLLLVSVLFLSATYPSVRNSIVRWIDVPSGGSISNIFDPTTNAQYWYPPLTFGTQNQAGSWDPLPMLWTFASLGIMASIPNVANMIKSLMAGRGIEGPDLTGKGSALAMGLGLGAATGKWLGGGALDYGLTRLGPGEPGSTTIEGWRATPRQGKVGTVQRWVGRGLSQVGEKRGLRYSPSSATGWYRKGDRPSPQP